MILADPTLGRIKILMLRPLFDLTLVQQVSSQESLSEYDSDLLFEVDDIGRLHIYHPGVALWKAESK